MWKDYENLSPILGSWDRWGNIKLSWKAKVDGVETPIELRMSVEEAEDLQKIIKRLLNED